MKWLVLCLLVVFVLWYGNVVYHQFEHAVVITDYWKANNDQSVWKLVHLEGDSPELYDFMSVKGYWEIVIQLLPVWIVFVVFTLILLPLMIFIYRGCAHHQISAAKHAQRAAEKRAYDTQINAQKEINMAYEEQLSRVKKELETEWENYHKHKNDLLERESTLQNKEQAAQKIKNLAKNRMENMVEKYKQEKHRFETEMLDMTRARDHAQAGYQRIKKQLEKRKRLNVNQL